MSRRYFWMLFLSLALISPPNISASFRQVENDQSYTSDGKPFGEIILAQRRDDWRRRQQIEQQRRLEAQRRQRQIEQQRRLEAQRRQRQIEQQRRLEAQRRQRQIEQQRRLEAQKRQRQVEQQRRLEAQKRQRQVEQQRRLEAQKRQRQVEQQRRLEAQKRQRQIEQQRRLEAQKRQRQVEQQRRLEAQKRQRQIEQQRRLEAQRRQRQLQQQKQLEAQRKQRQLEQQRRLEAQRRQRQLQQQRQLQAEKRRRAIEYQRLIQAEISRRALERQRHLEAERWRLAGERERQLEEERLKREEERQMRLEEEKWRREEERQSRLEEERLKREEEGLRRLEEEKWQKEIEREERLEKEKWRREEEREKRLEAARLKLEEEKWKKEEERLIKLEEETGQKIVKKKSDIFSMFPKEKLSSSWRAPKNTRILAVAVGDFKDASIQQVSNAASDAKYFASFASSSGIPKENITCLTDEKATRNEITDALMKLKMATTEKSETAIVYFSGHGAPIMKNGKIVDSVIVPYDAKGSSMKLTGIKMSTLQEILSDVRGNWVVILDSCFSGKSGRSLMPQGVKALAVVPKDFNIVPKSAKNTWWVTATSGDNYANSFPKKNLGLFTYYFMEALNGKKEADLNRDGFISLREAFAWTDSEVKAVSSKSLGRPQDPEIIGEGDTVLTILR